MPQKLGRVTVDDDWDPERKVTVRAGDLLDLAEAMAERDELREQVGYVRSKPALDLLVRGERMREHLDRSASSLNFEEASELGKLVREIQNRIDDRLDEERALWLDWRLKKAANVTAEQMGADVTFPDLEPTDPAEEEATASVGEAE